MHGQDILMTIPPRVLNVYKPPGMTSAQVVAFFKKRFYKIRYGKIGHFGTLDPFAEGVLLLGFSGASRLSDYVHKWLSKTYRAKGKWGEKTDTGDKTGVVIEKKPVVLPPFTESSGLLAERFQGKYWQMPPHFSSVKHKGRPSYEYARRGVFIKKHSVLRKIHFLGEFEWNQEHLNFTCRVSAGTYIRVLFEEMAEALGNVGHLDKLVRCSIGSCNYQNALVREQWELSPEELVSYGQELDKILPLDGLYLGKSDGSKFKNGGRIKVSDKVYFKNPLGVCSRHCWVYGEDSLLGLAYKGKYGPIACFNLRY